MTAGSGELADRIEAGRPLRRGDRHDLAEALGSRPARQLARDIDGHQQARRTRSATASGRPRTGLWGWLFPLPHQGHEPLPDPIARAVNRLRTAEPLGPEDARAVARRVGKAGARRLQRQLKRQPARLRRATHQKGRIR